MESEALISCYADPNLAIIGAFFDKFGKMFGPPLPSTSTLVSWLLREDKVPPELTNLHLQLLRRVFRNVKPEKWERSAIKYMQTYSLQDAAHLDQFGYLNTTIHLKLRLLKNLFESQFDNNPKLRAAINHLTPEELRSKPIGKDKDGCIYWSQIDGSANLRVFREDPQVEGDEGWAVVAHDRASLVQLLHKLTGDDSLDLSPIVEPAKDNPVLDTGQESDEGDDEECASLSDGAQQLDDDSNSQEKTDKAPILLKDKEKNVECNEEDDEEETNDDDDDCSTEIEDPTMYVCGEGSGADCDALNFPDDFECSESVEEPTFYVYGCGEGALCDAGNPDGDPQDDETSAPVSSTDQAISNPPISEEADSGAVDTTNSASNDGLVNSTSCDTTSQCAEAEVTATCSVSSSRDVPSTSADESVSSSDCSRHNPRVWSIDDICGSTEPSSSIAATDVDRSEPVDSVSDRVAQNADCPTVSSSDNQLDAVASSRNESIIDSRDEVNPGSVGNSIDEVSTSYAGATAYQPYSSDSILVFKPKKNLPSSSSSSSNQPDSPSSKITEMSSIGTSNLPFDDVGNQAEVDPTVEEQQSEGRISEDSKDDETHQEAEVLDQPSKESSQPGLDDEKSDERTSVSEIGKPKTTCDIPDSPISEELSKNEDTRRLLTVPDIIVTPNTPTADDANSPSGESLHVSEPRIVENVSGSATCDDVAKLDSVDLTKSDEISESKLDSSELNKRGDVVESKLDLLVPEKCEEISESMLEINQQSGDSSHLPNVKTNDSHLECNRKELKDDSINEETIQTNDSHLECNRKELKDDSIDEEIDRRNACSDTVLGPSPVENSSAAISDLENDGETAKEISESAAGPRSVADAKDDSHEEITVDSSKNSEETARIELPIQQLGEATDPLKKESVSNDDDDETIPCLDSSASNFESSDARKSTDTNQSSVDDTRHTEVLKKDVDSENSNERSDKTLITDNEVSCSENPLDTSKEPLKDATSATTEQNVLDSPAIDEVNTEGKTTEKETEENEMAGRISEAIESKTEQAISSDTVTDVMSTEAVVEKGALTLVADVTPEAKHLQESEAIKSESSSENATNDSESKAKVDDAVETHPSGISESKSAKTVTEEADSNCATKLENDVGVNLPETKEKDEVAFENKSAEPEDASEEKDRLENQIPKSSAITQNSKSDVSSPISPSMEKAPPERKKKLKVVANKNNSETVAKDSLTPKNVKKKKDLVKKKEDSVPEGDSKTSKKGKTVMNRVTNKKVDRQGTVGTEVDPLSISSEDLIESKKMKETSEKEIERNERIESMASDILGENYCVSTATTTFALSDKTEAEISVGEKSEVSDVSVKDGKEEESAERNDGVILGDKEKTDEENAAKGGKKRGRQALDIPPERKSTRNRGGTAVAFAEVPAKKVKKTVEKKAVKESEQGEKNAKMEEEVEETKEKGPDEQDNVAAASKEGPRVDKKPSPAKKGRPKKAPARKKTAKEEVEEDDTEDASEEKQKKTTPARGHAAISGREMKHLQWGKQAGADSLEDGGRSVRQSRRIAQQKLREDADRREHEEAVKVVTTASKSKKSKKQKKKEEEEMRKRIEEENMKKFKSFPKFKKHPWLSSSDDEHELEEEPEEDEIEEEPEEENIFKSDHEFSPESDIEEDPEYQPIKQARTARARKAEKTEEGYEDTNCEGCETSERPDEILLCDTCDKGWHTTCLKPPLELVPEGQWFCATCGHDALVESLKLTLREYDRLEKQRENEELRKKRLAFVGISLDNVLPTKKQKKPHSDVEEKEEDGAESSNSESSGSGSTTSDSEPIYQLRERRSAVTSYRYNEYDEMIRSAIQDEFPETAAAEKAKPVEKTPVSKEPEDDIETEDDETAGKPPAKSSPVEAAVAAAKTAKPPAADGSDDEEGYSAETEDDELCDELPPVVPKNKEISNKKKRRKLTTLEFSSEDDHNSDSDFKGSDSEAGESDEEVTGSDSSERWTKKGRAAAVRRSTRARTRRYDKDFINDDTSEDEKPKRKRREFDSSESSDSDRSWGGRRGRKSKRRRAPSLSPLRKRKRKHKKKKRGDLEEDTGRKKSRIKYGGLDSDGDDKVLNRRTRGKKINYVDGDEDSESEGETVKKKKKKADSESDKEFVADDDEKDDEEEEEVDEGVPENEESDESDKSEEKQVVPEKKKKVAETKRPKSKSKKKNKRKIDSDSEEENEEDLDELDEDEEEKLMDMLDQDGDIAVDDLKAAVKKAKEEKKNKPKEDIAKAAEEKNKPKVVVAKTKEEKKNKPKVEVAKTTPLVLAHAKMPDSKPKKRNVKITPTRAELLAAKEKQKKIEMEKSSESEDASPEQTTPEESNSPKPQKVRSNPKEVPHSTNTEDELSDTTEDDSEPLKETDKSPAPQSLLHAQLQQPQKNSPNKPYSPLEAMYNVRASAPRPPMAQDQAGWRPSGPQVMPNSPGRNAGAGPNMQMPNPFQGPPHMVRSPIRHPGKPMDMRPPGQGQGFHPRNQPNIRPPFNPYPSNQLQPINHPTDATGPFPSGPPPMRPGAPMQPGQYPPNQGPPRQAGPFPPGQSPPGAPRPGMPFPTNQPPRPGMPMPQAGQFPNPSSGPPRLGGPPGAYPPNQPPPGPRPGGPMTQAPPYPPNQPTRPPMQTGPFPPTNQPPGPPRPGAPPQQYPMPGQQPYLNSSPDYSPPNDPVKQRRKPGPKPGSKNRKKTDEDAQGGASPAKGRPRGKKEEVTIATVQAPTQFPDPVAPEGGSVITRMLNSPQGARPLPEPNNRFPGTPVYHQAHPMDPSPSGGAAVTITKPFVEDNNFQQQYQNYPSYPNYQGEQAAHNFPPQQPYSEPPSNFPPANQQPPAAATAQPASASAPEKAYEEEGEGVFGGLASYFASQAEEEMDT